MQLTDSELCQLLGDLESFRVERTVSVSKNDKFGEAICAFANDMPGSGLPGYLLIGVDDKKGTPTGIDVTDKLLLDLAQFKNDGRILPQPSMQIEKRTVDGKDIVVIEVLPSLLPPVRYNRVVWIRIGPRRARASGQDEHILMERRVASARTFDASPCLDAILADLSTQEFSAYRPHAVAPDVIEANHRSLEEQLASLRLYNPKIQTPTYAGILLLATDPRQWLSGAYIQFLRFTGTDIADTPVSEKEIGGSLATLLRQLDELVRIHLTQSARPISALQEKNVQDYPVWALRELLLNAVMHRNYESTQPIRFYWFADRIEIHNPGGLYGEAQTNFPHNNAYRNPIVAEILKNLGYVNRFGHGIARAQKELRENGNDEATFFKEKDVFAVTIRGAR